VAWTFEESPHAQTGIQSCFSGIRKHPDSVRARTELATSTGCGTDEEVRIAISKTAIIHRDPNALQATAGTSSILICYVHQQYTKAEPEL
jgi:hypothetical protein